MPSNDIHTQQEKLELLLSKVQKEAVRDIFIYGVTDRSRRGFFQKINDFLIDHSTVPIKEKAYFFELLATMIKAGIPLNQSLKILTAKTENMRLRRVIATLSYELEHGKPLSASLDHFPDIFDDTERGVIRSAEAIGNLEGMLAKISENLDKKHELIMKLQGALIYPIAVLIALVIGIGVMMVFVVPKIKNVFSESSLSLPVTTQVLIGVSTFLQNFWWLIAVIIIFIAIAAHIYTRTPEGRFIWDFKKLRIPFVGNILRKLYVLRFVSTLGLMIESGLPINKALEFVAISIGNEVYRVKTYEVLARVAEGEKLSRALSDSPFLFPETVHNMVAVAEHAAALGSITTKIGNHYEREIDHTLKSMTTVLGPVLILFIGGTVAFFALAILSPLFSLTQSIQ